MASASALAAFALTLALLAVSILRRRDFDATSTAGLLIFFTSPYVVMAAHLNGYYDNLLVLVSVVSAFAALKSRPWLAGLLLAVGVLVHEPIFIMGFPMVLLVAAHQHLLRHPDGSFWRVIWLFWRRHFGLIALPTVAITLIYVNQTYYLDADVLREALTARIRRYPFVENDRSAEVALAYTTPFLDYFHGEILRLD